MKLFNMPLKEEGHNPMISWILQSETPIPRNINHPIIVLLTSRNDVETVIWDTTEGEEPGFYCDRTNSLIPESIIKAWTPYPILKGVPP